MVEMVEVVGVCFENNTNVYYFKAEDLKLKKGETVVVESEMGISMANVVVANFTPEDTETEYKPVLRRADDQDRRRTKENEALKKEAEAFFNERIEARGLPMKLLGLEVTLDRRRIIFYFIAETRIDFRELVKDLASKFRTRIELRQIGVRDAARVVGGYGICGREFCCKSFLRSFAPISIKMAKQQGLVLNTCKLSGVCGRLMCCLHYEYDENGPPERKAKKREDETPATEEVPVKEEAAAEPVAVAVTAPPGSEPAEAASPEVVNAQADAPATPAAPGTGRKRRRPRRNRRRRKKKPAGSAENKPG